MIGVFDSGFGGLTVHRALVAALPQEDFVYLGDNANAPYGGRPPLDILNLTCAGIDRLFAEGCTLVVVACNTASVIALRWIQQQWLPNRILKDGIRRNVLGVVVPTVEAATETAADGETIAVFATKRTVESGVYPFEINKRRPGLHVVQEACAKLAGALESGAAEEDLRILVNAYVGAVREKPARVILGCTHYPLVLPLFARALPAGTPIISQAEATARALTAYLPRHPEYASSPGTGKRRFLSTGYTKDALPLIETFWGGTLKFEKT